MPGLDWMRIVLVGPETAGNVGAAARAMQTMGLSHLCVVAPECDPKSHEAYWMAHNAADVLDRLHHVDSLETALRDTVFSIATTRRTRRQRAPYFTPEEAAQLALQRGGEQPVALVFGRESRGLTNPELALCSVQSTIPAAVESQSLNLAQAVMLYCYVFFQATLSPESRSFGWKLATHAEFERLYAHLAETLSQLGVRPATTMESYLARFRRVLSRIPLETRDLKLLHNLLKRSHRES